MSIRSMTMSSVRTAKTLKDDVIEALTHPRIIDAVAEESAMEAWARSALRDEMIRAVTAAASTDVVRAIIRRATSETTKTLEAHSNLLPLTELVKVLAGYNKPITRAALLLRLQRARIEPAVKGKRGRGSAAMYNVIAVLRNMNVG